MDALARLMRTGSLSRRPRRTAAEMLAVRQKRAANLFIRMQKRRLRERAAWDASVRRVAKKRERELRQGLKRAKQAMACRKMERMMTEKVLRCRSKIR